LRLPRSERAELLRYWISQIQTSPHTLVVSIIAAFGDLTPRVAFETAEGAPGCSFTALDTETGSPCPVILVPQAASGPWTPSGRSPPGRRVPIGGTLVRLEEVSAAGSVNERTPSAGMRR